MSTATCHPHSWDYLLYGKYSAHHAFISPIGLSSLAHSCIFDFCRLLSCSSIITPLLLTFGLSELWPTSYWLDILHSMERPTLRYMHPSWEEMLIFLRIWDGGHQSLYYVSTSSSVCCKRIQQEDWQLKMRCCIPGFFSTMMMMHRWSAMTINYRVIITSLSKKSIITLPVIVQWHEIIIR